MKRYLLLGAGIRRAKYVKIGDGPEDFSDGELTTLDLDPDTGCDITFDMDNVWFGEKLPLPDNHFDEIHAYECMERWGEMGNVHGFYNEWKEYWRILKPGGFFCGTAPKPDSFVALGEPSHVRIVAPPMWHMLLNRRYLDSTAENTPVIAYRNLWPAPYCFEARHYGEFDYQNVFIFEKVVAE